MFAGPIFSLIPFLEATVAVRSTYLLFTEYEGLERLSDADPTTCFWIALQFTRLLMVGSIFMLAAGFMKALLPACAFGGDYIPQSFYREYLACDLFSCMMRLGAISAIFDFTEPRFTSLPVLFKLGAVLVSLYFLADCWKTLRIVPRQVFRGPAYTEGELYGWFLKWKKEIGRNLGEEKQSVVSFLTALQSTDEYVTRCTQRGIICLS